jgi:transposase InsO family protein
MEMKGRSVSERWSCRLIGISRSSYRYRPIGRDDGWLAVKLREIAKENPAAGYRTAWGYLRRDGFPVNHKRVLRTWREAGLTQPVKRKRKRSKGGAVPLEATHENHVWTYDFVHDRTEDNQALWMLTVEDEYTREGLTVAVGRNMPAKRVQETLTELFSVRGAPEYLRSDNGPELVAAELTEWLVEQGVQTHHIDPGSPWQNAYGESFNAILRRECLNRDLFHSMLEARIKTELWRRKYNERRPHSSLGYLTPVQFRDGVRIPLLERGRPSCHQRAREIEKQRQAKKNSGLCLQVVQFQGAG